MFLIGIGQLVLAIVGVDDCNGDNNPYTFICSLKDNGNQLMFWLPSITILIGSILGFIFSCLLRKMIANDEEERTDCPFTSSNQL
jgi:hypothetical protein